MNVRIAVLAAVVLAATCSASSCDPSSDYYSHYYKVTLSNGYTQSSAQSWIETKLFNQYGISSSNLKSWSFGWSSVTFRVYYGIAGKISGTSTARTADALNTASIFTSSATALGFSSCDQVCAPGSNDASSSSSYDNTYSSWYQVSLTSGQTGSAAKTAISNALYNKYSLSSSSLSGWYYSGSYTTFRIYYGYSGKVAGTSQANAANGLSNAQTNSTLRSQLGFASCQATIDPNLGAAVAAAFGTLFIVLILIGVAIVICVIAIIVCCCCCTAKAVADASAPPQQTVVMAQQPMMGQPGYAAQPGYAQPGQVQGTV